MDYYHRHHHQWQLVRLDDGPGALVMRQALTRSSQGHAGLLDSGLSVGNRGLPGQMSHEFGLWMVLSHAGLQSRPVKALVIEQSLGQGWLVVLTLELGFWPRLS